jgi:hypothetical protein
MYVLCQLAAPGLKWFHYTEIQLRTVDKTLTVYKYFPYCTVLTGTVLEAVPINFVLYALPLANRNFGALIWLPISIWCPK